MKSTFAVLICKGFLFCKAVYAGTCANGSYHLKTLHFILVYPLTFVHCQTSLHTFYLPGC